MVVILREEEMKVMKAMKMKESNGYNGRKLKASSNEEERRRSSICLLVILWK